MSFREGSARSGLQVLLETCRLLFGWEFDHDRHGPRAVFDGVAARTVIVPLQPIVDVARQADGVTLRVAVAAKHVHKSLANSAHAVAKAIPGPRCGIESLADVVRKTAPDAKPYADSAISGFEWCGRICLFAALTTSKVRGRCRFKSVGGSAFAAAPLRRDSLRGEKTRLPSRSSPQASEGWLGGRDLNPDNVVQRRKPRRRR